MQAILCKEWGNPDILVFDSLSLPRLAPHEVRIKVSCVGLQLVDILMIQGRYQAKPPFPFIPGGEVSGEIAEVGEKVEGLHIGDKVLALCETGGLAEYVQVSWKNIIFIPEYISAETVVALGLSYATAYLGLVHRASIQPGQKLLVLGASGSMGLAAVDIGSFLGAEVIAVGSTSERLQAAEQAGARHLIAYQEVNFKQALKEITAQKGIQVAYDPVGGEIFSEMLGCMAWESQIISVGFASGTIPQPPINRLLIQNITLSGLHFQGYQKRHPHKIKAAFRTLLQWQQASNIHPIISKICTFEKAKEALNAVLNKQKIGKIIVKIN